MHPVQCRCRLSSKKFHLASSGGGKYSILSTFSGPNARYRVFPLSIIPCALASGLPNVGGASMKKFVLWLLWLSLLSKRNLQVALAAYEFREKSNGFSHPDKNTTD